MMKAKRSIRRMGDRPLGTFVSSLCWCFRVDADMLPNESQFQISLSNKRETAVSIISSNKIG